MDLQLDKPVSASQLQKLETAPWDKPIPLLPFIPAALDYPLDALPGILQQTISTYQCYGQQPISLVACGALANISLACQSLANVARDHYLLSPVS